MIGLGCLAFLAIRPAAADTAPSVQEPVFTSVDAICDMKNGVPFLDVQNFLQSTVYQYKLLPLLQRTIASEDSKIDASMAQTIKRTGTIDLAAISSQRSKRHQDILTDMGLQENFCSIYGTCQGGDAALQQKMRDSTRGQLERALSNRHGESNGGASVTFAPPTVADIAAYQNLPNIDVLLQDPTTHPLRCVAPGAPKWQQDVQTATSTFVKHYIRLRSVPAQLATPAAPASGTSSAPDLSHVADNNYLSGNAAKLSFGQTSGTSAVTNNVIGVLGVPLALGSLGALRDITLTPYIGMDRETKIQTTKGVTTTTFSANTLDYGVALSTDIPAPHDTDLPWWFVSVRPDYLRNFVDGSDILSLNTQFSPVFYDEYVPINHTTDACDPTPDKMMVKCMLQLDLRANAGWFMNYGHPTEPSLNHDYVRLGGLIGPQLEFDLLPSNPIDIGASYTDFYAARGFSKSLGLFQASGTFNFDPSKIVGLTLQYSNGRRDDTAARVQLWSIGLTLHY
jgi:hypothetical protein